MYKLDDDYSLDVPCVRDIDVYVDLCLEATEASPFHKMGRTRNNVSEALTTWLQNPDFVCIVLVYKETPVGLLIGFITKDHPSLDMNVGMELVWFVQPQHRKSKGSRKMVEAFEYWSKMKGASACIMAAYDRRFDKLYSKQGYKPLETTYIKEL